jgi:hypothetical protein
MMGFVEELAAVAHIGAPLRLIGAVDKGGEQ